jgi:hypothetical protein
MQSKTSSTILKKNLQKVDRFSRQKGQMRIRILYTYPESGLAKKCRLRIHNTTGFENCRAPTVLSPATAYFAF